MYGTANYGRQVLLNPSTQYTGGLATPDINTRGGVFGPQGYGGGIFDGMSGLGQDDSDSYDRNLMIAAGLLIVAGIAVMVARRKR